MTFPRRNHRSSGARLASYAFAVLAPAAAHAQYTSSVQGTVLDPSGAAIPAANVSLVNTGTGVILTTVSNKAGQYRFLSLVPGEYTIKVSASGFGSATVSRTVQTEETVGLNVSLALESSAAVVNVSSEAPLLNPDETRLQYTLSAQELEELPTQSHGTLNFLKLAPGTTGINEGVSDLSTNRNHVDLAANGLSNGSNLTTLDGVPLNSAIVFDSSTEGGINGALTFTPNPDSLGEIGLQTTTFTVDYGNAASAQVSLSTKAGVNKVHGDADFTYGDRILNATPYNGVNSAANHLNLISVAGGGPIWKDHTFVFGSYEHQAQYAAGSGTARWYTPEALAILGNPANDPHQLNVQHYLIANPASRLIDDGKSYVTASQLFGTNCGTPAAYNLPCATNVTYEGIANTPFLLNGKTWNVRGDQYLRGGKDRVSIFYFSQDQNSTSTSPNPEFDGATPTNGHDLTANYTHTFTPNLLNTATFGDTFFKFEFNNTPHSPNLLLVPFQTFIFDQGSIGLFGIGFTRFTPFGNQEQQLYGRDTVLWTKGRHSFSFGAEGVNNYATNTNFVYARVFQNFFYSTTDFLNDQLDEEGVYSHYNSTSGAFQPFEGNATNTRFGIYGEDSWKISPRLTVSYGLRWDDLGNPQPYTGSINWANTFYNAGSQFSTVASSVLSKQVSHVFSSSRTGNVLPRGGFAYTISPSGSPLTTVLRGGVGLFQDIVNIEAVATSLTSNAPVGALGIFAQRGGTGVQPLLSYGSDATQPPYGFSFPTISVGSYNPDGSPVGTSTNLAGVDPNLATARAVLWNFGLEQQFPANMVASVTYSGSHGYNLHYTPDFNRPAGNQYCTVNGQPVLPNGTTCGPATTAQNTPASHLVNPHWTAIAPLVAGEISNYDALVAQLTERFKKLTLQASYTWSHTLDEPSGSATSNAFTSGSILELQYNPAAQYARANYDVPNRFTSSFLFEVPVPGQWNQLLKETLGGWQLNGEVIAQSGQPATFFYSGAQYDFTGSGNGSGYGIPDYTGTKRDFSRRDLQAGIFQNSNLAAIFSAPSCGACIGSAGRNAFRLANYATWDQSIQKRIPLPWIKEGKSNLIVRGSAFNVLNRVNLNDQTLSNTINNGGFGETSSAFQPRNIQVGGRFEF